jgi:PhzF family phenazine biosynthesis protein
MPRPFAQVDVFGATPYGGNPVAVVLDGEGLTSEQMQRFAHWTNLSETTFVLRPSVPGADYRVRIFTPTSELPFAGHPTLGTCHAWLARDRTAPGDVVLQECGAGLVPVRRTADRLAFAAPRCCAPDRSRSRWWRASPRPWASTAPRSWTPSGPTTGRGGWPCCWPARRRC